MLGKSAKAVLQFQIEVELIAFRRATEKLDQVAYQNGRRGIRRDIAAKGEIAER